MLTRALAAALLSCFSLSAQPASPPDTALPRPLLCLTISTSDMKTFPVFAVWDDGAVLFDATPFVDNDYMPMLAHSGPAGAKRVRDILDETGFATAPKNYLVVLHVSPTWHAYIYRDDERVTHGWNTGNFSHDYDKPYTDMWRRLLAALESDLPANSTPAPRHCRDCGPLDPFYPGCEWPFGDPPVYPEPAFDPNAPLPTPIVSVHDSQAYIRAMEHALAANDYPKAWSLLQSFWPALTTPPDVLRRTGHLLPRLEPILKDLADNHPQAHDLLLTESNRLFETLSNAGTFDMQTHMLRPLSLCLDTALAQEERGHKWYRTHRMDRSIECQRYIAVSFWPKVKWIMNGSSVDRRDGVDSLHFAWESWKDMPARLPADLKNRGELLQFFLDRARQATASLYVAFLALGLDDRAAAVARIAEQHDPDRDFPCASLLRLALDEGQFRPIHLEWIANASTRGADVGPFLERVREYTARTSTPEGLSR